jgi:glutamate-1-semialdehyde 2,1-aminomutase
MGQRLRLGIEKTFADRGILACCTGHPNAAVPGSSLASVHFPYSADLKLTCPEQVGNPDLSDIVLREKVLKLGLLVQDVNVSHGVGAVSMAHSDADIERTLEAVDQVAKRIASE